MRKGVSSFKTAVVYPLNPKKLIKINFELDEDVSRTVFELKRLKWEGQRLAMPWKVHRYR
jgi:hypothetical protein